MISSFVIFLQGNRLQAVIFDRDIDLRDDTLHVFQSYYIGNAYVKAIDPRHKIEAHQYQWIINSKTIIENLEDDEPALKAPEYNIISFNELDAYKDTDSEIDILAVTIQMKPPREVNTIHGKTTVQDIQVIDESLKPLRLTMWARFVHDECQQISNIIAVKPIILGTRIKVGSYNGLSLSSKPTSVFIIDPLLAPAVSLRTWATQNDGLLEEIIAKNLDTSRGSTSTSAMQTITKISEITEVIESTEPIAKPTFTVKGKFLLLDLRQLFCYMSCANCNKATGYDYNEKFLCYNCKEMSIGQPRCRVYLEIEDDTGCISVVVFGLMAEEILNSTAVDLFEHTGEVKYMFINLFKKIYCIMFYIFFIIIGASIVFSKHCKYSFRKRMDYTLARRNESIWTITPK
ncbi:replication protein A 70 kDa DNA-binding subunit B-like [Juglans regia]|uniref:Replication protein A 70 kDa DNA-binding subunit B-like n=1 Tax=Juglans regia TaxID=51240 RepID=A0A6P9E530_JUGRE|nr:replication protein A 70 kDa DNA-binding subunit B-like [Juglans regia]